MYSHCHIRYAIFVVINICH